VLARAGLGKIASEEILAQIGNSKFATLTFESVPDALKWAGGAENVSAPSG
jgi:hypothetical protein